MKKILIIVMFVFACPVYIHAQLLSFSTGQDTVYYENEPGISAVLYPDSEGLEKQIFATSFLLSCNPGRIEYDSAYISLYSKLTYGKDHLSLTGKQDESLAFGLTGIRPGIDFKEQLDSLLIEFTIADLSPDDSIIELKLFNILEKDNRGYSSEYNDMNLSVLLRHKPPEAIENLEYNRIDGLTTYYNKQDASLSLHYPEIDINGKIIINIYDINGRLLITKQLNDNKEKIHIPQLISGVYLIETKFKSNQLFKYMCTKLIIPY